MLQWVQYANSRGFNLSGRSRRSEYWWNCLFYMIISISLGAVMGIVDAILLAISDKLSFLVFIVNGAMFLVSIFIFLKMLPIAIRRLHDTGKSGWLYLLCIVGNACCGIGSIVLILLMCMDSTPGPNQYGPNPKESDTGYNGPYGQGQGQQYGNYGQGQGQGQQQYGAYGQGQGLGQYTQGQSQGQYGQGQQQNNNQNNYFQ